MSPPSQRNEQGHHNTAPSSDEKPTRVSSPQQHVQEHPLGEVKLQEQQLNHQQQGRQQQHEQQQRQQHPRQLQRQKQPQQQEKQQQQQQQEQQQLKQTQIQTAQTNSESKVHSMNLQPEHKSPRDSEPATVNKSTDVQSDLNNAELQLATVNNSTDVQSDLNNAELQLERRKQGKESDCHTLSNQRMSAPEESDEASKIQQTSITSDYETMTSTSPLTSATQTPREQAEMRLASPTSDLSLMLPQSLSATMLSEPGSADVSPCTDSVTFFQSHPEYPTVIYVCKPENKGQKSAENAEDVVAAARMKPDNGTPQPGPEQEVQEEEKERRQEEEQGRADEEEEEREEEEMFPPSVLNTPIGALRKSRRRLCLMLNIEMADEGETGLCPDYRGLAELLGFEALEIANFWERNPSDTLFLEWARSRDGRLQPAVLATLVSCLRSLRRQDVLHDCRGWILEDVSDYLAEQHLLNHYSPNRLEKYDCYVNIADADILTVGREIVDILEGVYGLRLCLTLRDIPLGGWEYETMATTLETRCDSKVLLVLTRNYEDSEACQFLMQFATTLDPCSRQSKLIPLLVDEDAYIPRAIRSLARLNFKRDKELGFLWPRLKHIVTR